MDVLSLSRLQFAMTAGFHFLFVPLILLYQSWFYRIFREKIPSEGSDENLYL